MWLITPVGFFSVVRKPGDLAAGTLTEAFATMLREIDYANFKDAVATRQGPGRAEVYGKVWGTLLALTPGARPSPPERFRGPRLSR